MSDETPVDTATPTDEPKAETPAHAPAPAEAVPHASPEAAAAPDEPASEGAVPQAEASIEEVTAPDPEAAPEPEPAPPPEVAEVAAAVATLNEQQEHAVAEPAVAPAEETAPEQEVEALVPVEEPVAEPPAEPAPEPPAEAEKPAKPKKSRAKKAAAAEAPAETAAVATEEEPTETVTPAEEPAEPKPENKKKWYAVKVQSGREDTIKAAILRKVAIEGLEEYFGGIEIPVEEVIEKKQVRVKDKKTGDYVYQEKKVTKKKKKFHGYIFANVEFNDRILYLFRETSGVGDFLNVRGSPGAPVAEPMPEHEVQAMLTGVSVKDPLKKPKVKIDFEKGDRVRIREGSFANQEGDVKVITEPKDPTDSPKITVTVTLWGRPVDVDVEHWQVEKV